MTLRARYESDAVLIASLSIISSAAAMAAQLIRAARLLEGSTGLVTGRTDLFALTVVDHTAIGRFRGVVLNDTLQGVVMTIATIALFFMVVNRGGGIANIVQELKATNVGMITPFVCRKVYDHSLCNELPVLVGFT